jgi:hypothetical protein
MAFSSSDRLREEVNKDILIRVTATNCGPVLAPLYVLPTLWSMELRGAASKPKNNLKETRRYSEESA